MNEICRFGSNRITCEVHPTARVYFGTGVVGQFLSNYLAEIGHRIPILEKISINGSVELLGIPDLYRTSGPIYNDNLLDPRDTTGWGDGDTSNQNWGVQPGRPYSNAAMAWGNNIPACPAFMISSLENARAAVRRVRDDCLHGRRRAHMQIPFISCKPVRNPRINCRGDDRGCPVDQ